MNLISQSVNTDYDTYGSAVVAAPDCVTAMNMDPGNGGPVDWEDRQWCWCPSPEDVRATFIGTAHEDVEQGVICSNFRAG